MFILPWLVLLDLYIPHHMVLQISKILLICCGHRSINAGGSRGEKEGEVACRAPSSPF